MSFIRFMNWSDFFLGSKVNNLAEDRTLMSPLLKLFNFQQAQAVSSLCTVKSISS